MHTVILLSKDPSVQSIHLRKICPLLTLDNTKYIILSPSTKRTFLQRSVLALQVSLMRGTWTTVCKTCLNRLTTSWINPLAHIMLSCRLQGQSSSWKSSRAGTSILWCHYRKQIWHGMPLRRSCVLPDQKGYCVQSASREVGDSLTMARKIGSSTTGGPGKAKVSPRIARWLIKGGGVFCV